MKTSQRGCVEMPAVCASLASDRKQRGGRYAGTLVLALSLLWVPLGCGGSAGASGTNSSKAPANSAGNSAAPNPANQTEQPDKPKQPEQPKEEVAEATLKDIHKDYEGDRKGAKTRWEKKLIRFAAPSFFLTDVESGGKPWLSASSDTLYHARCVLSQRDEAEIKLLKVCQTESIGLAIEGRVKEMERDYKRQINVLVVADCKVVPPTPEGAAKNIRDMLAKGDARNAVTAQAWLGKYQRASILKDGDALAAVLAKEVDEQVNKTTHIEITKLLADFKADSHAAHNNYENIQLQLKGRVKDLETDRPGFKGVAFFKLTDDAGNSVECQSTKKEDIEAAAKAGSIVTIRGNCRGVLTDERGKPIGSWLDYCEVVPEK